METKQINISVTVEQYEKLRQQARDEGDRIKKIVTVTEYIRGKVEKMSEKKK